MRLYDYLNKRVTLLDDTLNQWEGVVDTYVSKLDSEYDEEYIYLELDKDKALVEFKLHEIKSIA